MTLCQGRGRAVRSSLPMTKRTPPSPGPATESRGRVSNGTEETG